MATTMIESLAEEADTKHPVTETAPTEMIPRDEYLKKSLRQRKRGCSQIFFNGPPPWLRRQWLEENEKAGEIDQQNVRTASNANQDVENEVSEIAEESCCP